MDKLIVTIAGITAIVGIYRFFFGKQEESATAGSDFAVTVDGGYQPSTITVIPDKPVTITFTRKDPNTCLEEIIFPEYKIMEYLPMNKPVKITLPPPHTGGDFHCGMNMYHGKIVVGKTN